MMKLQRFTAAISFPRKKYGVPEVLIEAALLCIRKFENPKAGKSQ
jgi:hypothetical protein